LVYQNEIDILVNLVYHLDKEHLLYINYKNQFNKYSKRKRKLPYGRTASSALIL
jgi:hypothetical protein